MNRSVLPSVRVLMARVVGKWQIETAVVSLGDMASYMVAGYRFCFIDPDDEPVIDAYLLRRR